MTTKTHSSLAHIARAIGADMASGGLSRASQAAMRSMEGSPEIAFDLVGLIGKEGARLGSEAWQGFAIVARELLGQRPLDEIGLMKAVAETSLAVMSMNRPPGVSHAA